MRAGSGEARRRVRVALAALACGALLLGCAKDKVTGQNRFSVVDWSPDEELALGREAAPLVEAEFDSIVLDRASQEYLSRLIHEMGEHSVRKGELTFDFHVLNSSIPNAFALPGGYVYITRGLLSELVSEAQFISILGHELGHVEHQHAMFSQSRRSVATAPGRAISRVGRRVPVLRRVTGAAGNLVTVGPALFVLKYDRGQELEADDRGIYFSSAMGYDPRDGLETFVLFERLAAQEGGSGELSLLSTHPSDEKRITQMEATIQRDYADYIAATASFRTGAGEFERIVKGLRAAAPAYALYDEAFAQLHEEGFADAAVLRADEILRRGRALLPDEPLFLIALGELAMLRESHAEATLRFKEAVSLYEGYSESHGHWKPFYYMGLLSLLAEDPIAAVRYLKGADARCPAIPALQFLFAQAEEMRGNRAGAIERYRKVLELAPKGSGMHRAAQERLEEL